MGEHILLLILILACAVGEDLYAYRISNVWIAAGLITGLIRQILCNGYMGVKESIAGMIVPVLILFPVFLCRGIGAGDIKLLSVVGSYLSYHASFSILAASVLLGGIYAMIQILRGKRSEKLHMSIPIMLSTVIWLEGII
ncbi:MAG: prepilin peptidase [Lachnospiraceae bacterium]|nr:prepilin peptidase [Lachnospiraceae bacterium]